MLEILTMQILLVMSFEVAQNFASSTVKLELQLDDYGSETSLGNSK